MYAYHIESSMGCVMKKIISILFVLSLCCIAIGASSLDNRYALVIGNSKYQENALRNPVNDAKLVAGKLEECGFKVNFAYDIDGQQLRNTVASFAQRVNADPNAVAMFYYSGHGLQIEGSNYLVPIDNKSITDETTAKALSYRLDDYLQTVKAPTQIVVLDACRNNPYTSTGSRAVSIKGGLATIQGRKGTSLSYLYSTQAGETAEDGTGANSLFTTIFVEEIGKTNVELTSVFNSVNNRVKEMTEGKQVPLYSGTGTNFYFMTPELADLEIARWEAELKKAKDALNANIALTGRQSSIEQETAKASAEAAQRLAQAELTAAQALKERVTREAKALEEEKLAKSARSAAQQKKIDAIRASAEAAATQVRLQRIDASNAQGQVNFIEAQKLELKKITDSQQTIIQAYERDASIEMERKITEVQNRPFQKAELGSDGYPTANALLMRKRIIENIREQYSGVGNDFSQQAYQSVAVQLSKISDSVKDAIESLEGKIFTESSIMNELRISLSNFDGEKAGWHLTFDSQITKTNGKPVFSGTVFLAYENLTGLKNNQLTSDLDAYYEYLDQVDMYDSLFRASTPIITAELTYTIKSSAGSTVYTVNPINGVIKRSDNGKIILSIKPDGNMLVPVSVIPTPIIDIRSPEELASYPKSTLTFTNWWGDVLTMTVPKGNPVTVPEFISSGKFVQVAAGSYHSLALRDDGVLFSTGLNDRGQLGTGSQVSHTAWKRVLTDVKQISAGERHSLALLSDGAVYATGYNEFGQLGTGNRTDSLQFNPVLTEVREIAGGGNMSFMVKKDNTLWACGENKYGQLGIGNTYDQLEPVKIMDGVLKVAVGQNHVLVLKTDNSLWGCGYNDYGQLGNGTNTSSNTFIKIMSDCSAFAAGKNHSLVVKKDSSLWSFGYNDDGRLGNGNTYTQTRPVRITDGVVAVAAGAWHSLFLDKQGNLYSFGSNEDGNYRTIGRLGNDSDYSYQKTPQKVLSGVVALSAGHNHTLVISSFGEILACGFEGKGYGLFGNDSFMGSIHNSFIKVSNPPSYWYGQGLMFKSGDVAIASVNSFSMVDSLKIGEHGPAGGFVFYDKGTYGNGWRYLEADTKDMNRGNTYEFVWGGYGKELGPSAQGLSIGTGKLNTETIVARFGNNEPYKNNSAYAAKLCDENDSGGFDDWFLPSKDELYMMYSLKLKGVGGFSDDYYWSSSEYSAGNAWYQSFGSGSQDYYYRGNALRVRPVRAF